jgi:RNA helicase armi
MQMKFPKDHFTHVIIDEAGQSTEPETLIPMTLLGKKSGQVILAGDPQQLGPIMISRHAKNLDLELSMLERLLTTNECYARKNDEFDPRFVTQLKINYRSVPSVLNVYNDLFYNSQLEATINDETSSEAELLSILEDILWNNETANKKCGVYFIDMVNGRNRKVPDSCSWYNEEEMSAIISFLSKINSMGIPFKDCGVITPYALQVKKLKHKASTNLPDTDLKIGTVEEFQGQERHIILVSTVRSEERHFNTDSKFGLGFLQCEKRMNVSISRARSLLVVFGRSEILVKDERWKQLIDYTKKNSTYVIDSRK